MDTLQTIRERRSVRRYRPDPIPAEHLAQIIEAGRLAPSAANRQPWRFVLVSESEQKAALAQACRGQEWMAQAAYILVGVGLPDVSAKWYAVDVAIAMQNMVLAAWSLGYGTCWIGAFDPDQVKQVCGIPDGAEVVACTPIGVPDVSPEPRPRKQVGEVFADGRFDRPWQG